MEFQKSHKYNHVPLTAWSPGGNPVELKFILFGQLLLISNLNLSIALPDVIV